jgi:hypothetical protein
MNDAANPVPLPHGKTAALEDREHRAVLTQHFSLKVCKPLAAGKRGQMCEEA